MRVGKWIAGVVGSPAGLILTGAAVAWVTMPAVRRRVRPLLVSTVRSAYRVGDRLKAVAQASASEMGNIMQEARAGMTPVGPVMAGAGTTMGALRSNIAEGFDTARDAAERVTHSAREAAETFMDEMNENRGPRRLPD